MPSLFQMLQSYIQQATKDQDSAQTAEKALCALTQFASQMDDTDIKPYLKAGLEIIDAYMNGPNQKPKVKFQALCALSPFIIAAEHLIHPYMTSLL